MDKIIAACIGCLLFISISIFAFEYGSDQSSTFENVPGFKSLDDYLIGSGLLQLKMQKEYNNSLIDAINNIGASGGSNLSLDSLLGGLLGGSNGSGGVTGIATLQINTSIGQVNQNVANIFGDKNTVTSYSKQSNDAGALNSSSTNSTSFLNQPNSSGTVSNSLGGTANINK